MDVLFLEEIEFQVPYRDFGRCKVAASQEEVLRAAMVVVGLELIDYGSFTVGIAVIAGDTRQPVAEYSLRINAFSQAYRERLERAPLRP